MSEPWLLVGVLLVGAALGLWWGERLGVRLGYRLGEAAAPLELRRQSLRDARCLLCGSQPDAHEDGGAPPEPVLDDASGDGRTPPRPDET